VVVAVVVVLVVSIMAVVVAVLVVVLTNTARVVFQERSSVVRLVTLAPVELAGLTGQRAPIPLSVWRIPV
jgi:hypothetical protein